MADRSLPDFDDLWSSYPSRQSPCRQQRPDGSLRWPNQCAIRMSIALEGAGFRLTDYTDPKCAHGHARGAESLANYLWKQVGPPDDTSFASDDTKKGLVFFKNIQGFRGGQGDHIDLWNAGVTKTGAYFTSSDTVWFWEVE